MTNAPLIDPRRRAAAGYRWALLRYFEVPDQADPTRVHLRRLRIVQTPWFAVYIHWIYLPDTDRDPHDHPWPFASWIIRGGYTERVFTTRDSAIRHRRGRWSVHRLTTRVAHQIDVLDSATTTLVLVGRRSREWGFWTEEGWVPWRRYGTDPESEGSLDD